MARLTLPARAGLVFCVALLALMSAGCQGIGAPQETLTVLAGSELKDLEPLLGDILQETGISLEMTYIGTLEGAELLMAGEQVDLAWFSHAKYLLLLEGASQRILAQEKIMLSPVVLGVKRSKAEAWGWVDNPAVTWGDIANKASLGELRYAMTNPTSSNTGFTALVGAAAAFAGAGDALTIDEIDSVSAELRQFLQGQALTAGSSGWLAEQFISEQDRLDGMINYESVLLSLNQSGQLEEELTLIYPQEGIITADYPLMLVNGNQREAYNRLVDYLRSPEFQKKLMERTLRRPAIASVPVSANFPDALLIELPFPSNKEVIDHLLFVYLDKASIPGHSFFVLDVSGSMKGDRLTALKNSLAVLTGADQSLTGQFARFRDRERVTLITFSSQVLDERFFEVNLAESDSFSDIEAFTNGLEANGRTAIYDSLQLAYEQAILAQQTDPNRYYTIVLMSDGLSNSGADEDDFLRFFAGLPAGHNIKTFVILFGEADEEAMQTIAERTGGRVFDAKNTPLEVIFKQIRGYQ